MPEPILLPNGVTVLGKPYPRTCVRCRTRTVWPVTTPYRATVRYESQTYDLDLPALVVPRCANCGELYFDNYADHQINQALRSRLNLLTPAQIHAQRAALGLSAVELAARIGVHPEVVGQWEAEARLQSRAEDQRLRQLFQLVG